MHDTLSCGNILDAMYNLCDRAGELVTFCWRLQRSKGFAAEQESETLQYEIRIEVDLMCSQAL